MSFACNKDFRLLQIEDAMLMFDKQTNRHRGKLIFCCCMIVRERGIEEERGRVSDWV